MIHLRVVDCSKNAAD